MSNSKLIAAALVILSGYGTGAGAADTVVERTAVFKNGIAYFSDRLELPRGPAEVPVATCTTPIHGTFWLDADEAAGLESVVARTATDATTTGARQLSELVLANAGRRLRLTLTDGTTLEGSVEAPDAADAGFVIIHAEEGATALALPTIARVQPADDGGLSTELEGTSERTELVAELGAHGRGGQARLSYLAGDITWAPSYRVDIAAPPRASITRKAVVINEACDLEQVELILVTGYPTFELAHVPSPLALKGGLDGFLRAVGRPPGSSRDRVMHTQAANYVASVDTTSYRPPPGTAVEDLFVESVGRIDLDRGEVGVYLLSADEVPFRHVYSWEIPDLTDEQTNRRAEDEEHDDVWHSLRLVNETGGPWTTAPALVVNGPDVVAQTTLGYTPAGATSLVRLTRALSVEAEQVERELGRTREAEQIRGHRYDRVELEGVLRVINHLGQTIRLEITKTVRGELSDSTPTAAVDTVARGLKAVNPTRQLRWQLSLEPEQEQRVMYTYTLLLR